MQLENTHFILLVLFYLISVGLITLQSGLFEVPPLTKYCWMLQHDMLYSKEWKTQEQAVVLVAFPAVTLLLLLSNVFRCGIVTGLHWQVAMTRETTQASLLSLNSTNSPFLTGGLMPTHLCSLFLFFCLFLASLMHSGWRSSHKQKANISALLPHWEVLF